MPGRRVNTSQYAVLGMLSVGPQSGYDLKKLIDRSIAHFWSESFGQIYPILRRLEADGLAVRRRAGAGGARDRQVYAITPTGLEALARWLVHPARPDGFRSELLLKLFLGGRISVDDNVRQVQQFKAGQVELLRIYGDVERRLHREQAGHPDLPYWLMTLRYGVRRTTALVRWSDETLRALERLRRRSRSRRRTR
jgi:PadR family transcriptional regulator AphA